MKVFISHAPSDEILARQVADFLEQSGFEVWDERQILPGENWAAKVAEALQESEAMVVLLTADALRASNVRWEIEYALGKKDFSGRLIPVLVGDRYAIGQDEIPWILRRLATIRLPEHDPEGGIQQIAEALQNAPREYAQDGLIP